MPLTRESIQASLGAAIRAERTKQRMTQEQVAHEAGLAMNYISELERGRRNPSLVTLFSLADALKIAPDTLIRRAARTFG